MKRSISRTSQVDKWFRAFAVVFWLSIWQVASMAVNQMIILPSPIRTAQTLWGLLHQAPFYRAVLGSFIRILLGFVLALGSGMLLATLAAGSRYVRMLVDFPMAAIGASPIASFAILALVMIGKENLSVFIAFLMALPVIYLNVLKGIDSADAKLIEMADVFRINRARKIRAIYLPAAVPYLLSACRIALGMCWKSGLAAEVIGQPDGSIGDALYRAKIFLETDAVFAWTVAIIALSIGFEQIVMLVMRRLGRD